MESTTPECLQYIMYPFQNWKIEKIHLQFFDLCKVTVVSLSPSSSPVAVENRIFDFWKVFYLLKIYRT